MAVPVKGRLVAEGDDGEGGRRRGRRFAGFALQPFFEALPCIVVRDDDRASAGKRLVAARMIAVPVGVENEFDRLVGDLRDRSHDLLRQGGELIVDDERAVGTDGKADIPAGPFKHVDARRHRDRLDLDGAEVSLGEGG